MGAQTVEIVRRGAWNVCKLLASPASLCEVKGVYTECWPIVANMHHLYCKGSSNCMEIANSFVEFFHDIICLLALQAL